MDKGSGLPLNELPWVFIDYWSGKMDEKLYIATFLAPNMGWLHDYKYLKEFEKLPSGSELRTLVNKRIGWEIISEYGFHARIGRTLEKTGSSLAHLDQEKLERVIAKYFCFRTCTAKDKETDKNLIDCIYLYRKFTSEAIRILLPVSILSGADRKPHSFVAALQLGLKRMFKGKIDHLQTTLHEEPLPNSSFKRKYLVLYDTVPGGTGYLKQLMRSKEPLLEVLELALESLRFLLMQPTIGQGWLLSLFIRISEQLYNG